MFESGRDDICIFMIDRDRLFLGGLSTLMAEDQLASGDGPAHAEKERCYFLKVLGSFREVYLLRSEKTFYKMRPQVSTKPTV